MTIQIYNTLSRQKEPFETYEPGKVSMYVCGPTVYDSAHIGHAMSYLVFDMIRRYLEYRGYTVNHVQNFTDVDDKIINRAKDTGEPWDTITTRYINEFIADMESLNVQRAHTYPCASREIPAIIEMIQGLIEKGYAYESQGDVYFRVQRDEDYGKLAHRKLEEQQAGTRVSDAERDRKEHPLDFALWKADKGEDPHWDSPWGVGRPGWHIECSAMSLRYLGEKIDIHGGGADLIFPHHENEIAQTESYTGQVPFSRYWLHNGLLQVSGEKMSKSLKNFFTIRQFLTHHSADALRLFVLSSQYRRPVTYTEESFAAAERALERFHAALAPARAAAQDDDPALAQFAQETAEKFHGAMGDDFNSALALGALFELARALNNARDQGKGGTAFTEAQKTLHNLLLLLGFSLEDDSRKPKGGTDSAPFIELLIQVRNNLRTAKQWALSDEIRDGLSQLDIVLEDTPEGTIWKYQ
ncbi:MAG: cysteine--tRNA ligase [Ardenticatenales bacterium]|nr:cysteine--tRNA ligase [Ardenticatenales bacterium]